MNETQQYSEAITKIEQTIVTASVVHRPHPGTRSMRHAMVSFNVRQEFEVATDVFFRGEQDSHMSCLRAIKTRTCVAPIAIHKVPWTARVISGVSTLV